jgi:K+-sensing histidine kinase KdpD
VTNKQTEKPKQLFSESSPLLVTTRVKVLLTLLTGIVVTILVVFLARYQYMDSLLNRVETMATMLDPARVESIKARDENAETNEVYLKNKLLIARSVNSDAQALYVLATTKTNLVYYLVDSETAGAPVGQPYKDASEALKASFYSGAPFIEGPVTTQSDTKLSVISPVFDHTGQQIAVIGMRVLPSSYYSLMIVAALIPVIATLLLSAVFVMTDTMRKRRQESVRMRSELVSIASHELRTPLTGIRWGEESLMRNKLEKTSRDVLQSMYDSTIRLQESIEDILQLANWQAGRKQELLKTSTDLIHVFEGIFATQKLPAAQKNVTLEFDRKMPKKLLITCDAQRMKRVLNNLISNAIKYSKQGTSVVIGHERVDGKHVITIRDHGIGIPADEQEKVFAGFYRATNAVAQESNGTGMGLYMSRNTIEQHGGKLWLVSEEGKGTTVYIELP